MHTHSTASSAPGCSCGCLAIPPGERVRAHFLVGKRGNPNGGRIASTYLELVEGRRRIHAVMACRVAAARRCTCCSNLPSLPPPRIGSWDGSMVRRLFESHSRAKSTPAIFLGGGGYRSFGGCTVQLHGDEQAAGKKCNSCPNDTTPISPTILTERCVYAGLKSGGTRHTLGSQPGPQGGAQW